MDNHFTKNKQYYIETMGCQMNVHDSEVLAGHLENMGYVKALYIEEADVFILNTCAVRKKAEEKVFSRLGKLKPLKENRKDMVMILWGCMSQQEHIANKMKERFNFIDIISGIHSLGRFPELLEKANTSKETIIELNEEAGRENLPIKREHDFKAWVPVSHGCNNYCTYCVVPYVRGPEKSRSTEVVIKEVEELASNGYKEITLLGQNVNSYGKDLEGNINFAQLLTYLDGIQGLDMIRFMTSHPRDFSDEIILAIKNGNNICEHIHLPLQAGSNHILEKMNRGYTKEYYLELVQAIRKHLPDVSITTDLIVGFPGEKEEDFEDTLSMIKNIQFDSAFSFIYSPREGTKASEMEDQIVPEIKKKRIIKLNEIQNGISLDKNRTLLGTEQTVLVEGKSKTNPNMFTGRTRTNKLVHFPSEINITGMLVKIIIKEAQAWSLKGTVKNNFF